MNESHKSKWDVPCGPWRGRVAMLLAVTVLTACPDGPDPDDVTPYPFERFMARWEVDRRLATSSTIVHDYLNEIRKLRHDFGDRTTIWANDVVDFLAHHRVRSMISKGEAPDHFLLLSVLHFVTDLSPLWLSPAPPQPTIPAPEKWGDWPRSLELDPDAVAEFHALSWPEELLAPVFEKPAFPVGYRLQAVFPTLYHLGEARQVHVGVPVIEELAFEPEVCGGPPGLRFVVCAYVGELSRKQPWSYPEYRLAAEWALLELLVSPDPCVHPGLLDCFVHKPTWYLMEFVPSFFLESSR